MSGRGARPETKSAERAFASWSTGSRRIRASADKTSSGETRAGSPGIRFLAAAILGAAACGLAGCATSSHRLIGTPRPPISAEQVELYLETPPRPYREIALLDASSRRSWSLSYEGKAEVVIRRLKAQAAKVGANGVLLKGITDEPGPAVGTDLGTHYESPRGTVDLGVGAGTLLVSRYGSAIAIYLEPD
jgi:hypothetical protein